MSLCSIQERFLNSLLSRVLDVVGFWLFTFIWVAANSPKKTDVGFLGGKASG